MMILHGRWINIDPSAKLREDIIHCSYAFDNSVFFIDFERMTPQSDEVSFFEYVAVRLMANMVCRNVNYTLCFN